MSVHPDLENQTQTLTLGLGRDGDATTAKVLQGEPQVNVLLEDFFFIASGVGLVDDILLAGQSVMCSDQSCDPLMFHPEAYMEGHRSIGAAFHKNQKVTVKATLDANGTVQAWCGVQGLPGEVEAAGFPDVNGLGDKLNYVFGLGKKQIAAAGVDVLTAKATRKCKLGMLVLNADSAGIDIEVQSVKVNNRPMLNGRNDTTIDSVGILAYGFLATDIDGRVLAIDVDVNDVVTVTFKNNNAGAIIVRGGIFVLPADEAAPANE